MDFDPGMAEHFTAQRPRLLGMAARVLGSQADAEDVVQEAWLRLQRQQSGHVENLADWLTTVVGRLCLDVLRTRRNRDEVSYEGRLPDLVVSEDHGDVDDVSDHADRLGLAMLVVLGTLGPQERLALVLHDVFALPFAEIGPIIGRSADAAKMAASRARRKVRAAPRPSGSLQQRREVVDAFLAAARDGDFVALLLVLDPDVTWELHTRRTVASTIGADPVSDAVQRGLRSHFVARRVRVNGEPGILAWGSNGRPVAVMACTVSGGRITALMSVVDPPRLAAIDLPPRIQGDRRT